MSSPSSLSNGSSAVSSPRAVPFKVVVCGLPRTGTSSVQAALRLLGIHDVYHWQSVHPRGHDIDLWNRAVDAKFKGKGTFTRHDWDTLFATYQACCDTPAAMFSVEIAAAYPDAKVIILNRDPESWYKSCMSSIYAVSASVPWWHMLLIISCDPLMLKFGLFVIRVRNDVFGFAWPEKEKALAFYDRYHREFREGIAAERILEYRVQDGWGPLCKHLGIEPPRMRVDGREGVEVEMPFPRLNDARSHRSTGEFKLRKSRMRAYRNLREAIAFVGLAICLMPQLVRLVSFVARGLSGVSSDQREL